MWDCRSRHSGSRPNKESFHLTSSFSKPMNMQRSHSDLRTDADTNVTLCSFLNNHFLSNFLTDVRVNPPNKQRKANWEHDAYFYSIKAAALVMVQRSNS